MLGLNFFVFVLRPPFDHYLVARGPKEKKLAEQSKAESPESNIAERSFHVDKEEHDPNETDYEPQDETNGL